MNDKNLKKLRRADLLQILIAQGKEIERLEKALKDAEEIINNRTIDIEKVGSLAEAALVINKVFAAADEAANQYIDNVKQRCIDYEESLKKKIEDEL